MLCVRITCSMFFVDGINTRLYNKSVPNGTLLGAIGLNSFFLFQGLSDDERNSILAEFSYEKEFEKGSVLNSMPVDGTSIGIIQTGTAKCFVKNTDIVMRIFRSGDMFGATSLFQDVEVSRIVATSFCRVVFFKRESFQALLQLYPVVSLNYIRFLTGRVCFLNQKIELYSIDNAERKVFFYLVSQANERGDVELTNMSLISRILGIGRTTLYRSFNQLENKHIISKSGKNYHLEVLDL